MLINVVQYISGERDASFNVVPRCIDLMWRVGVVIHLEALSSVGEFTGLQRLAAIIAFGGCI